MKGNRNTLGYMRTFLTRLWRLVTFDWRTIPSERLEFASVAKNVQNITGSANCVTPAISTANVVSVASEKADPFNLIDDPSEEAEPGVNRYDPSRC